MQLHLKIRILSSGLGKSVTAAAVAPIKRGIAAALPKIGNMVVEHLARAADQKLHGTAAQYKRGLQQPGSVSVGDSNVVVSLVGDLPEALEQGFPAFDIKAKMLPHAHRFTAGGDPFIDVPFRFSMQARATNMQGVPPDIAASMQSSVRRAQRAARAEGASTDAASIARARMSMKTAGASVDKTLHMPGGSMGVRVTHKQGIYDDMIRTAARGNKKSVGQYGTIRRISASSDPMSWWHPGFAGVKLFATAAADVESAARQILLDEINKHIKR